MQRVRRGYFKLVDNTDERTALVLREDLGKLVIIVLRRSMSGDEDSQRVYLTPEHLQVVLQEAPNYLEEVLVKSPGQRLFESEEHDLAWTDLAHQHVRFYEERAQKLGIQPLEE